jgi:hypothetical protein
MAICEKCGTFYSPSPTALDCPSCTAKPKRPAGAGASGAPPSKVVPGAAARRPASTVPHAGHPGARPASSASPSARPSAGAQRVHAAAATPSAVRRARAQEPVEAEEPAREIHHPGPKSAIDNVTRIGLIITGGLAVVVLGIVMVVMSKKSAERERFDAWNREVEGLHAELLALDLTDEAEATSLIAKAKEKEARWTEHDRARDIQTLMNRAKASLESGKERRETMGRFTDIESKLKTPSASSVAEISEMRRTLEELEVKLTVGGADLLARWTLARTAADKAYAMRLADDAAAQAQANPDNLRKALTTFTTTEDEIRKLLDRSVHEKQQELQGFYADLYKRVISESDRLITSIFAKESSDSLQAIDCLVGDQAALWNASSAKGFSHRVEKHTLQIVGPDADAGKIAVVSIGDREQWRSLVLDVEFTIEKGNVELYFHLGRNPNANTPFYTLATEGDDSNVSAGKTYRAKMSLLGSQFNVRFAGEDLDTPRPLEKPLTWSSTRKGGIGLLVPPGARVRFTRFEVRELR